MVQNDLLKVLMDMRSGAVAADINAKFNEMIASVLENRGKGELTITLKAEPSRFGKTGAVLEVQTEHSVKMKKPELSIGKSTFFVASDGRLTRDDPAQTAMFEIPAQVEQKERAR